MKHNGCMLTFSTWPLYCVSASIFRYSVFCRLFFPLPSSSLLRVMNPQDFFFWFSVTKVKKKTVQLIMMYQSMMVELNEVKNAIGYITFLDARSINSIHYSFVRVFSILFISFFSSFFLCCFSLISHSAEFY